VLSPFGSNISTQIVRKSMEILDAGGTCGQKKTRRPGEDPRRRRFSFHS